MVIIDGTTTGNKIAKAMASTKVGTLKVTGAVGNDQSKQQRVLMASLRVPVNLLGLFSNNEGNQQFFWGSTEEDVYNVWGRYLSYKTVTSTGSTTTSETAFGAFC
ncbi:MAG: hypothetical protein CM15mP83_8160 [Flavobacteriaceae bacterium]|nr:MAG: hypothetical protein CM15mP83_8160 [Flavobacteriaceae bacterium]